MPNQKGLLEDKFETYYSDINIFNYRAIFEEIVREYRGEEFKRILDIGSGIGLFLESMKPFGYDLYALEASKTGLKKLRQKKINALEFYLEEGKKLPFEENYFSSVVFNQVIEHIDKKTGSYYIKEIIRVLEPGGVAIIKSPSYYSKIWRTDPHHIYCWKPYELLKEVKKYSKQIDNIHMQEIVVEPWMFQNYSEKTIDTWHKYNKYPKLRRVYSVLGKALYKTTKSQKLLAVSNITFIKKKT